MTKFRTFFLVSLVILATVMCLFVQVIIGIKTTVLNPQYYSNIMQKHNLYDLPQNYIHISIKNQFDDVLSEPLCKALVPAINTAFSDEWAEYQSDKIITSTINYIKGKEEDIQLQIPLKDRKVILHGEITSFLEKQYTEDDLLNFQIESTEEIASIIVKSTNIPDSINMLEALNFSQKGFNKILDELKHYYNFIAFMPYLLFLLIISLIIYIGRGKGLKWLAYGVVMASFITVALVSFTNILADEFIIDHITNQSELLLTIGINPLILANILKNSIISSINKIALGFGALGIIFFISGNHWAKTLKKKNPTIKPKSF